MCAPELSYTIKAVARQTGKQCFACVVRESGYCRSLQSIEIRGMDVVKVSIADLLFFVCHLYPRRRDTLFTLPTKVEP
jgi:hypothetical protein